MSGGNRTVFIGNIPYGVTEEVIQEYLGRAGHVLNFRLVHDRETGKPKGYGFAEYSDADSAASAVRNLNGTEMMGRQLRVDYSNDGKDNAKDDGIPGPPDGAVELPPLPQGRDIPLNLKAEDAISETLKALPPAQLLDIMSQMKGLVMSDPSRATELLRQAPQLSYAIFQALLLLNLVDTKTLTSIISQQQQAPAPAAPPVQPIPQPQATPQAYPQHYPPQPPQAYGGQISTPPVHQAYQPPPSAPPAQPQAPPKTDLIAQLMSMPQSQIDALLPEQRAQIMALRQQYAGQY